MMIGSRDAMPAQPFMHPYRRTRMNTPRARLRMSLVLAVVAGFVSANQVHAITFTVTDAGDEAYCDPIPPPPTPVCATLDEADECNGPCTLRAAIEKANDIPGT